MEASVNGSHILLELSGCDRALLQDAVQLEQLLKQAAADGGATVVSSHFHLFAPQGVSGVVIIAESHVTIHTWPEKSYAAVDVFTCGHEDVSRQIATLIIDRMNPESHCQRTLIRQPQVLAQIL